MRGEGKSREESLILLLSSDFMIGTLGSFFYLLLSEVNTAARTHVSALGGNALLCHRLVPQEAGGKVARSQGYTMFSISGDAVLVEFTSTSESHDASMADLVIEWKEEEGDVK